MIGLDLTEEHLLTAHAFGFDWNDLVAIALDAVESSWLDTSEKAAMASRVRAGAAAAAIETDRGASG